MSPSSFRDVLFVSCCCGHNSQKRSGALHHLPVARAAAICLARFGQL